MTETTERGFELIQFDDANDKECSLQQSSATDGSDAGTSFIWLGVSGERMHLHRDHVEVLAEQLVTWLEYGSFGPMLFCKWSYDDVHEKWDTGCDNAFILAEGPPSDNKLKFCPYCGKPLKE